MAATLGLAPMLGAMSSAVLVAGKIALEEWTRPGNRNDFYQEEAVTMQIYGCAHFSSGSRYRAWAPALCDCPSPGSWEAPVESCGLSIGAGLLNCNQSLQSGWLEAAGSSCRGPLRAEVGGRNLIGLRGGSGDDVLQAKATGRRNRIRLRGGCGDDVLQAEAMGRRNRIRQRGRRGEDVLQAEATGRRNRIRQRGGRDEDVLQAEATGRRNRIRQRGKQGDDVLQAEATGRRNRIRQRGGRGEDVLQAEATGRRNRIRQRGKQGED
ncbi:hypothetical protein DYH09_14940, partial [bacterium CPR1]|nr:hypothetical protein [bacterium CPR1]